MVYLIIFTLLALDECHCVLCLTIAATFAWSTSKLRPPMAHCRRPATSFRHCFSIISDAEKTNLAASGYFQTYVTVVAIVHFLSEQDKKIWMAVFGLFWPHCVPSE